MDIVKIYLLGRFEILVNGSRIDDQLSKSRKSCLLIQYLILHRDQAVPYQELYDVLWPHEDIANPESALKTLVSRLRDLLGKYSPALKKCIGTIRGAYRWVDQCEVEVDTIQFEELCTTLKHVNSLEENNTSLFKRIYDLYTGDLLPVNSMETWIVSRSVYYQNLYLSAVYHHLDLLDSAGEYEDIITACRVALDINAFDERLHMTLMDALVKTNRTHDALIQYRHAAGMHVNFLGMPLSESMQAYYKQISDNGRLMDDDLERIRQDLNSYSENKGAYICDYTVFRELYNLLLRSLRRSNVTSMFLVLLMISSSDGQDMDPIQNDEIMQKLLEILKRHLRQSDIVTRFSSRQYLLMLPLKTYENGKTVMERMKRAFYSQEVTSKVVFNYRLLPISPNIE